VEGSSAFGPAPSIGVKECEEDRSKVLQLDVEVTVPTGNFTGWMKVEDYTPLDKVTE
jgi:hypothetical protein